MSTRHFVAPAVLGSAIALAAGACSIKTIEFGDGGNGGQGAGGADGGMGGDGADGGMGGEGGGPLAPPLRNPVDMEDADLAYEALLLLGYEALGSTVTTCSECHQINRGVMSNWRDLTDAAVASCFADTTVPSKSAAEDALACMKLKPGQANSPYHASKIGIYSGAAHLEWFDFVFDRAFDGDGSAEKTEFMNTVAMPKDMQTPWTQDELDIVAEWFARGLPFMEQFLPEPPQPGDCIPNITPRVGEHITEMSTAGWQAENESNGLLMFGCAGAATPLDCLSTYPLASTTSFGVNWEHLEGATLRVLRTNEYSSSFWTRSSADGRFVGHGGGPGSGSTIVDLANDSEINLAAAYDPSFFPDNSAFMFQGTSSGTGICTQDLLASGDMSITFDETECNNSASVGLYQHVGAALNGGDYWAVDGYFTSDNGGHFPTTENPDTGFDGGSNVDLTPMVYDGTSFVPKAQISKLTPLEGDHVMSKSSKLLIGRATGAGWSQNGFSLREVVATPNGNTYDVEVPVIARYCINGGKPGMSFDERWAVLHTYVTDDDAVELGFTGPSDPGFAAYRTQGAANIYLLDMLTGLVRRVTNMDPGQYALFPHFRSDGWIYFMVRNLNNKEQIVASDAALVLDN